MSKKFVVLIILIAIVIFGLSIIMSNNANANSGDECVPADAWTEEVLHEAVTHNEEIFDHWQRYSWTGGPHTSDSPPAFPSDDWQANVQGDPHNVGVAGAYFRSHGNSGNGDWFYLEAVTKTITVVDVEAWVEKIEHPAVVCEEKPTDPPTVIEPPVKEEDPVVHTETLTDEHKTVKIETHKSGKKTREVVHYPANLNEEGL